MGGGAEGGREESGLMSLRPGIVVRLSDGGPRGEALLLFWKE
jgi:hypothetical protein